MNILEALASPHLFGNLEAFRDLTTWGAWIVLLKAAYGLPMTAGELEIFREHTGRDHPLPQGYSEVVAIVGRQSGKSQIASVIAVYEATRVEGRGTYAILVAQDERAALRTLFRYTSDPFDVSETLRAAVVSRTANMIELETGVSIAAYPCRPFAIRGLRSRVAICDELAFFRSTEGYPTDTEMLRALRPTLATTGGKLIVLSSPYGSTGALWELHRKHYGRDASSTLVWQASAPEMNPTLPADYLQRMEADDPEAFRSEVLGEFRAGVATFFDAHDLAACVIPDRCDLLRAQGVAYAAFVDPSGGGRDAFTVAVAHRGKGRIVVDCVRAWLPPFNPSGVVADAAAALKSYGCHAVTGDQYGGEWPREAFRAHGVYYRVAELDRSRLYLEMLPT